MTEGKSLKAAQVKSLGKGLSFSGVALMYCLRFFWCTVRSGGISWSDRIVSVLGNFLVHLLLISSLTKQLRNFAVSLNVFPF